MISADDPHHDDERLKREGGNHEIYMRGKAVHYIYLFDLGPGLNVEKLARRLLHHNLASIAAPLGSEDLRVSRAVLDAEKVQRAAEKLHTFTAELASDSPSFLTLLRSHPKLALRVLIAYLESVSRFLIGSHLGGQKGRVENSTGDSSESTQESGAREIIDEAREKSHQALISYLVSGGIRTRLDQKNYLPRYARADPYMRVELNRTFFKELNAEDWKALSASLLIHSTGVCLLTLSSDASRNDLNFDDIDRLTTASSRKLEELQLSLPIAASGSGMSVRKARKLNLPLETAEGTEWVTIKKNPDQDYHPTIHDVFASYLDAIKHMSRNKGGIDWECFTVVSLGRPLCECTPEVCKAVHKQELADLLFRTQPGIHVREETVGRLVENMLSVTKYELMISAGCALFIDWSADGPDLLRDVQVALAPIESAFVQHGELQQVDRLTLNTVLEDGDLFTAQKILATGLQEYRRGLLTGPDHRETVDAVLSKRRVPDLYAQLIDRVDLLESLVTSRYSRLQNRRQLAVAAASFLVVIFVLLPQLSDLFKTLETIDGWPQTAVAWMDETSGSRGNALLWSYFLLLALLTAVFLPLLRSKRTRPHRTTRYGRSLRGDYSVRLVQSDGVDHPPEDSQHPN